MKCDVIVTYCWNRVGYNILRSLSNQGLSVVIGDTSKWNICSLSHYAADSFIYSDPFTNEEKFISDLLEAVKKYRPRVLMPTHDEALIIAKHIKEFPSSLIFASDSYKNLITLSNKYESTIIAKSVDVPIPSIIDNIKEVNYPIVIKTRYGNSAKGVFFPKTCEEAENILKKYDKSQVLVQDFFNGIDYSVDCIRYKDFFKASCYKAIVTKTDGGGTSTQRVMIDKPILYEYAKKILDKVNYQGVCGLDFKVNEDNNTAAFIEVNTRFTGGLATPISAGFNIPFIYYQLLINSTFNEPIHIKYGTKTKWVLGDIIALVTKILKRTLKREEAKNIFSWKFDAYDDLYKDDIKAFGGELLYYFMKLIKNRKLNP